MGSSFGRLGLPGNSHGSNPRIFAEVDDRSERIEESCEFLLRLLERLGGDNETPTMTVVKGYKRATSRGDRLGVSTFFCYVILTMPLFEDYNARIMMHVL